MRRLAEWRNLSLMSPFAHTCFPSHSMRAQLSHHLILNPKILLTTPHASAQNMKSLLLSKYNHLEITDTPKPSPAPDEVLIEVAACGICGSDVHGFDGSTGRRIPPLVMGHEAAGRIAALGSSVSTFKVGERVTFDSTAFCGESPNCRRGDINLCDNRQVLGVSCGDYRRSGAFAEYVVVPSRIVHRLPDNL